MLNPYSITDALFEKFSQTILQQGFILYFLTCPFPLELFGKEKKSDTEFCTTSYFL